MDIGFKLYMVHVAGTRMIDQGTDGLSRGMLLGGVLTGKPMLDYIDLAKGALHRFPPLLNFVKNWIDCPNLEALTPEQWFVEAHGICGGSKDQHGVWIPKHASTGQMYLWAPPPPPSLCRCVFGRMFESSSQEEICLSCFYLA